MPAQVNIQKTIDITKNVAAASTDTSKEDEKKKQEKKDKYKVKFWRMFDLIHFKKFVNLL